jgi:hypothetical protein
VDVSVKWREKNISHPLAFVDLGQSDWINYELRILNYELQKKIIVLKDLIRSGDNPDGCAKEQPLKTLRASDRIRLECSETNERAFSVMKWSVKRTNDYNVMKWYNGCISPTNARRDRVKMRNKRPKK